MCGMFMYDWKQPAQQSRQAEILFGETFAGDDTEFLFTKTTIEREVSLKTLSLVENLSDLSFKPLSRCLLFSKMKSTHEYCWKISCHNQNYNWIFFRTFSFYRVPQKFVPLISWAKTFDQNFILLYRVHLFRSSVIVMDPLFFITLCSSCGIELNKSSGLKIIR